MSNQAVPPGKYDQFLAAELKELQAQGKEKYGEFREPLMRRMKEAWKLDDLQCQNVIGNYLMREHPDLCPPGFAGGFSHWRRTAAEPAPSKLLGEFDDLLSAEVEAQREAGRKPALIRMIKMVRDARSLGLREAQEIVTDYAARRCPELLSSAQGTQKGSAWFMLAVAAIVTAAVVRHSRSAFSLSVPIMFWIVAGATLAEAYWARGDVRRCRVDRGVGSVLYLALGIWVFCSTDEVYRWFGFVCLAFAVGTFVMALRNKKWP